MPRFLKRIILIISLLPIVGICFGNDEGINKITNHLYTTFSDSNAPTTSPIKQLEQVFEQVVHRNTDDKKLKASTSAFWKNRENHTQDLERLHYDVTLALYKKIEMFLLKKIKTANDNDKNKAILAAYYTYIAAYRVAYLPADWATYNATADDIYWAANKAANRVANLTYLTAERAANRAANRNSTYNVADGATYSVADKIIYSAAERFANWSANKAAKRASNRAAKNAAERESTTAWANKIFNVFTANKGQTVDTWRGWQMATISILLIMHQNMGHETRSGNIIDPRQMYESILNELTNKSINPGDTFLASIRSSLRQNIPARTEKVGAVLRPHIISDDDNIRKKYFQKFQSFFLNVFNIL